MYRLALASVFLFTAVGCLSSPYSRSIERATETPPEDFLAKAVVGPQGDGTYVVATTQVVAPAGESIEFPGRPTDIALSPDESVLVLKTTGRSTMTGSGGDLVFIDVASKTVRQLLEMEKGENNFCGLSWTSDGQAVWTTDAAGALRCARKGADGSFGWAGQIALPGPGGKDDSAPGGLLLDEPNGLIYVALSSNNSIAVVDVAAGKVEAEIPVGIAPYDVVTLGQTAYVSNWGGRRPKPGETTGPTSGSRAVVDPKTGIASTGTVSVVDLARRECIGEIEVGLHPSAMALSPDGGRLYVANANSDTVSVIDTRSNKVARTFDVKPSPRLPFGSAPNALELSRDGGTLYVANGGNNLLALLDAATGKIQGLIPTGWYPGAIDISRDGNLVCIANIKGLGTSYTQANVRAKLEMLGENWHGFNSHDHMGSANLVRMPSKAELEEYTYRAACNMRLPLMNGVLEMAPEEQKTVPVPTRPGEVSVFKHVLYIIKENRTYDQVFGDMPQGNGDATLCLFGRDVTPNHHALAEQFVLLDNFYCNGVLSADGHQWTDEGYATDYIEKSFGGWPRSYPYEGDDALAFASSGFIWDHVLRKGLTFRDYGEFVHARIEPPKSTLADIYSYYVSGTRTVNIKSESPQQTLEQYLCPTFVGFPGTVQDVYRAGEFLNEFREFEKTGALPNFMIMLLPNDHTNGTRENWPTPNAMVADNDLALGQIVEAVSKSKFWPETVILVVEDDPQAGLDHVDSHRTVALCISPYTKRGAVDSSFYTQAGMLRTIELIFGLEPMNQITMAANPMTNAFTATADLAPYTALPNNISLDQMNQKVAQLRGKARYYAKKSGEIPLDEIDQADEDLFNRIIWHAVKGYDVPYPKLAARIWDE
ncbi:MAG: bifunctional YncE family protein/alkaline phosphatase family protein [Candidatus Hydrogenedentes bacterium]|nr:bifunctional YncE family protein/alkaline phosphatase family protein [Candidatus Hydrogenedentota bacterium]